MVSMGSFYKIIFYSIAYILSSFSTNHITSCLGSRVDMISNFRPDFYDFCYFYSITTLPHQQNTYVAVQLMSIEIMMISALGMP
jgi:hypothetical protein